MKNKNLEAIQAWFISYLADLLEIEPAQIDIHKSFDSYGLDSASAITVVGDLEDWLGSSISSEIVYKYPSIEALSQHLAQDNGSTDP
ncbi:acyl carrier protein [Calothrix sp. PCC 7507]|uniref:acyl carrier protein n=1 Tax=Calothrix sp. PCC 7507 TaxID=99598 RepID=UPI00029F0961|nr:acyl carrier protein [Calothrix sp. PCC 7507]AFY34305.1 phosphopantetheine-binding protein [Calothrix sp. PCC 7507]